MHPPFSAIFLTTLIGAGQGLFLVLFGTELWLGPLALAPQAHLFLGIGSVVSLILTAGGLIASFFHLGQPQRAWRGMAMWRTSWLAREGIALPLFMAGVFAYGGAHLLGSDATMFVGAVTALLCLTLYVCTGMIYACIRFLQEWASPLTPVNYLLLGCASGATLATLLAALAAPVLVLPYAQVATVLTLLALITRGASLMRNARLKPKSTLQSAIGIKHPRIVQKAQGFMGGSFNTREFFHGRSAAMLRSIKWVFLVLVFPLPLLCLALGVSASSTALLLTAFALQYIGLLAERWFFFAQANHPQNLYYQTIS
jgi:sulfite dehydrogenase (quinone) subunit SoeC